MERLERAFRVATALGEDNHGLTRLEQLLRLRERSSIRRVTPDGKGANTGKQPGEKAHREEFGFCHEPHDTGYECSYGGGVKVADMVGTEQNAPRTRHVSAPLHPAPTVQREEKAHNRDTDCPQKKVSHTLDFRRSPAV